MSAQSTLYVVVEGATDAAVIRALAGKELAARLRFFATGGRASLVTIGRNILVHEGGPVLLVMDSDTRNQDLVNELRSMAFVAMSGVAQTSFERLSEWVKVFAFVPELEVVFFEAPKALEALLGRRVEEQTVHEGLLAPKATLINLVENSAIRYEALIAKITPATATALKSGPQVDALMAAIESLLLAPVDTA